MGALLLIGMWVIGLSSSKNTIVHIFLMKGLPKSGTVYFFEKPPTLTTGVLVALLTVAISRKSALALFYRTVAGGRPCCDLLAKRASEELQSREKSYFYWPTAQARFQRDEFPKSDVIFLERGLEGIIFPYKNHLHTLSFEDLFHL